MSAMMWDNDYGWGTWLAMSVGMVAFWTLLAVIVVALVRGMRDDRPRESEEGEFQHRRELLRSTSSSESRAARTR